MKKTVSVFLTLVLLLGCFVLPAHAAGRMLGDVDGNGQHTANDARMALRAAVKLDTLDGESFAAADVDHDGDVTAADARIILRAAVHLEALNADGTAFVPVVYVSPAKKIREYIVANQVFSEDGMHAYGFSDEQFDYAFIYDDTQGEKYVIGTVVSYEYDVYDYYVSVWMNDTFTDYIAQLEVYENGSDYGYAVYKLNYKTFSRENALNALTETDYQGLNGASKSNVKNMVASLASLGLYAFLYEIRDANIGVDHKKDMHLESIVL